MKTLTTKQFAAVKRVAQNVNYAVTKKNKIAEKISELSREYNDLTAEIEGHEVGIIRLTGHTSEELVTKVVETTDKVDKDGRPIKITKYEPKAGAVVYNEETKLYEIHIEDPELDSVQDGETADDTEEVPVVEGPSDLPFEA